MTTPSIIIPSTSVVLLDTRQYSGPIIVQLNSLKTIGTLITIRDTGGNISLTNPIILSTAKGVNFHDGTSSFNITVPFDTATVQPKTTATYELLNTFGFPQILNNTYASTLHTELLIANSSVSSNIGIDNLELVSSLYVAYSSIFYGPVVLSNSLYVSSPMTYFTDTIASTLIANRFQGSNIDTNAIVVNNLNVINLNIASTILQVNGPTLINQKIIFQSSFTTMSSASVLQVGSISSINISTAQTTANLTYQNLYQAEYISSISSIVTNLNTNNLRTSIFQVTNILSTGAIYPFTSRIGRGIINLVSSAAIITRNFSSLQVMLSTITTSSISLNDKITRTRYPLWAKDNILYYNNTNVYYDGQEITSLPSTVDGLGSLGYISSTNLPLDGFSTLFIRSRTLDTFYASVPSVVLPMISSISTVTSNVLASNVRLVFTNTSDILTTYLRTSTVITDTVYQNQISVSSIFANNLNTTDFHLKTLLGSTITINNLSTYSTTTKRLLANNLDTYSLSSPMLYSIDIQTSSLSTVYSIVNENTNFVNNYASSLTIKDSIATEQDTQYLQTNIVLFSDNPLGSLYFSSGFFYANNQKFTTLDNTNIDLISTTAGLGTLGYLSTFIIPDEFSTQQILANQIYARSSFQGIVIANRTTARQLITNSFQQNIYRASTMVLSTITASEGIFSTLTTRFVATNNFVIDSGRFQAAAFNFNTLIAKSSVTSTLSTRYLQISSFQVNTISNINVSSQIYTTNRVTISNYFTAQRTLPFLTSRTTNAAYIDVGYLTTSSLTSRSLFSYFTQLFRQSYNRQLTTNLTQAASLSSITANVVNMNQNTLYASTFRISTLAMVDNNMNVNLLYSSTGQLLYNTINIVNQIIENQVLTSTIVSLPYISSYSSNYFRAISAQTIYTSTVSSQQLIMNGFSTNSTFIRFLSTFSTGNFIATAASINASTIRAPRVNVSNLSTIMLTIYSLSSGSINMDTAYISSLRTTNAIIPSFSSLIIRAPNVSSVQTQTTNIIVSTLTAEFMAANELSTGRLAVDEVQVNAVYCGLNVSTAVTSADTISISYLSSGNLTAGYFLVSSIQGNIENIVYLSSQNLYSIKQNSLIEITDNSLISTILFNDLNTIKTSSGILFVSNNYLPTQNTVNNALFSTVNNLSGYMKIYAINGLSTQFVATSSLSTNYLTAGALRTSNMNSITLSTSQFSTSRIIASQLGSFSINTTVLNSSNIVAQQYNTSSIVTNILNTYNNTTVRANSQQTQVNTLEYNHLSLVSLASVSTNTTSSFATQTSVNTAVTSLLQVSSFQTNVLVNSIATASLTSNSLTTASSISSIVLVSRNLDTQDLFSQNLIAQNFTYSSIQLQALSVNLISSILVQTANATISSVITDYAETNNVYTGSLSTLQVLTSSMNLSSNISVISFSTNTLAVTTLAATTTQAATTQASTIIGANLQVSATSSLLNSYSVSAKAATNFTSTVQFNSNILSVYNDDLLLNGRLLFTFNSIDVNIISTGLATASIISSVQKVHALTIHAGQINQTSATSSFFGGSTLYQSSLNAQLVSLPNLTIISSSSAYPNNTINTNNTNQGLLINNFMNIKSTVGLGNSTSDTLLYVQGSARVPSTFVNALSVSSITSNNFKYNNIITSSYILSKSNTLTVQNTLTQVNTIQISSIEGTSTIILGTEGAYGLFYGNSTFNAAAYSTFTSTTTSIATNGHIYVATGQTIPSFYGFGPIGCNTLAYSYDGSNWSGLGSTIFTGANRVVWDGTEFFATGSGNSIAKSLDGISWSPVSPNIFSVGRGIVKGRTKYVAVGDGTNTIAYSYDGINWLGLGSNILSEGGYGVAVNYQRFIAVGSGSQTIAVSSDGITWSSLGSTIFSIRGNDIAWNGLMFVAVGLGTNSIAQSWDGLTWNGLGLSIFDEGLSITWSGSKWMATGYGANTLVYSTDGITWISPLQIVENISTFQYTGASSIVTAPQGTRYVKMQIWGAGGGGAGVSTINPNLMGANLWLDSYDQNTLLISSVSSVQAWYDKSSNIFVASGLATYQSSVKFLGSSQSLAIASNVIPATDSYTYLFVSQYNNGNQILMGNSTMSLSLSTNRFYWNTSGLIISTLNAVSTTSTNLMVLTAQPSSFTWRINGSQDSQQIGSYPLQSTSQTFLLGSYFDTRSDWSSTELISFASNLPLNAIQELEGYLAWKYNIQYLLSPSHPYKNQMSSINAGGGGAYIEGIYPLVPGLGSTFGIYVGQGGQFNSQQASKGIYQDVNGSTFLSTSGGVSYDSQYGMFYPSYFSSLGLWLDANDPLANGSQPSDGTSISTWYDKSSSNRNASSIEGMSATYKQNVLNSNSVLEFSSSKYQISYDNFNTSSYTIFTVQLQSTNRGTYQTVLSGGGTPMLFSGVLSNSITTFDTNVNYPLCNAMSWRLVDMLVVNSNQSPFVDGNPQAQKIGITGSFSTLFLGALSPGLQTWVGSNQIMSVYDPDGPVYGLTNSTFSTLVLTNEVPTNFYVFDTTDNSISTLSLPQGYYSSIVVYDGSPPYSSLSTFFQSGNQNALIFDTSFPIYDTSVVSFSSFIMNNQITNNLAVFDTTDNSISTFVLSQVYLDTLNVYDTDKSPPYSSMSLAKYRIEIENWLGSIGEVLVFDTVLSANQRQIIEGYLASKWGLQSNLPIGHPYKNNNIYSNSLIKGAGGGGGATGLVLPSGSLLAAAGGGGGGQGLSWGGGAGGLNIGQRGSEVDSTNTYGYSQYYSIRAAGGGGQSLGGQGALGSNDARGSQGQNWVGGQGGIDSWHVSLPGGGGGGGLYGGGGGAEILPAGGGSSKWLSPGFLTSLSYTTPGYGKGTGYGSGGNFMNSGSDGRIIMNFLVTPLTSNTHINTLAALESGWQNTSFDNINIQSGKPYFTTSTIMIQAMQSTIILNNVLAIDGNNNRVGINTSYYTADLQVNGTVSKTAGSFVINHPDPIKNDYKLRHSFVESPTTGDTLYTWSLSTFNSTFSYILPSYFGYLNENPQVWVTSLDTDFVGRGHIENNILRLETTGDGVFNILCVATRKDPDALAYMNGVDYQLECAKLGF